MRLLFMMIMAYLLTSCGPKSYAPLYESATPVVTPTPLLIPMVERSIPSIERQQLSFSLAEETFPDEDDYFNNPDFKRDNQETGPSVIIAVPEEVNQLSKNKQSNYQAKNDTEKELNDVFRTDGYYNEAEQAIEGALLRKGFNVLDRSKFEAKLRDLRDRANDTRYWWSNYDRLIENKDYDALKNLLAEKLKKGELSQTDYIKQISEVDEISQIGLPGKRRTEDEMTDIAEVIRAAQTGKEQADYLLQINGVAVSDAGNRMLPISELPQVQQFMKDNPGLRFGELPNALPLGIPSNWLRVEFNAKLIGVKTGSIVWLGSHEVESWAAEPIRINIDIQRKVNNADEVNGVIRKHNLKLRDLSNNLNSKAEQLRAAYAKGSQSRKFDKKEQYEIYRNNLQKEINSLTQQHSAALSKFVTAMNQPPAEAESNWTYSYIVSEPHIIPDLLADGRQSIAGEQRLLRHRRELIRTVTQQLISTIKL